MKIVITGGAGFIGSFLVDRLVRENNCAITVIDNLKRGVYDRIRHHVEQGKIQFIQGDIREFTMLEAALSGAEVVFHLAAQSNVLGAVADLDYSFSTNVVGTFQALKAAGAQGVKRFVFTSSREVYGEPEVLPVREDFPLNAKNAYGASKVAGESYCHVFGNMGLETVILRLANVYGPRDTERVIPLFISQLLQKSPLKVYGENKVLDFVWVETVIDSLLKAAFGPSWLTQPTNIGSGKGTRIVDLAAMLQAIMNTNLPVEVIAAREQEVNGYIANIDRAVELIGLDADQNLGNHLPKVVDFWLAQSSINHKRQQ